MIIGGMKGPRVATDPEAIQRLALDYTADINNPVDLRNTMLYMDHVGGGGGHGGMEAIRALAEGFGTDLPMGREVDVLTEYINESTTKRMALHDPHAGHWSLQVFTTNKEDDGPRRVGSESDVVDYVEARINTSLAALATGTGDDTTSTGDDATTSLAATTGGDVKPPGIDTGSDTEFSHSTTAPPSPSSSRGDATPEDATDTGDDAKLHSSAETNVKYGDVFRPYNYACESDDNPVFTSPTTEPHSLPWPRVWPDPTNGTMEGCTWADDEVEKEEDQEDQEDQEEEVFTAEEVCLFPSVWSKWTRTQPQKHDGTKDRRMARGVSMKPCATAKMGVSPRRVTQKLCPKEVHELLTAVARSPTGVLLEVGHLVRLLEALVTVALSTSGRIGGSGDRGGRAAVPEASRGVIRAGAPAARRRSSMTAENREEALAFSSSAKKEIKKAMRSDAPSAKGHRGAMKRNGGLERAKQAQRLQSWAAKAKRSVSSLVERLESARTEIGAEDAKLVILHAKGIPDEKAERDPMIIGGMKGPRVATDPEAIQRLALDYTADINNPVDLRNTMLYMDHVGGGGGHGGMEAIRALAEGFGTDLPMGREVDVLTEYINGSTTKRMALHDPHAGHWSLQVFTTNKEDDGPRRVGSESDVVDYVEARINTSLAALATGTGDDTTSPGGDATTTGGDVKPPGIDTGSDTEFSHSTTAPPSPSSSRGDATPEDATDTGDDAKLHSSAETNVKYGDVFRPYNYACESDDNPVFTSPTTEPHSLPWPRVWPDPTNGTMKGCPWANNEVEKEEDQEDQEEEVFTAEEVCLFPSVWGEWTRGPEEVCLFPSVWSKWTRTQPRKHGRVRGRGGRRTTRKKNNKQRCPRRRRERHRRRALRRKRQARRARVGGRRRRPPTSFRGGGGPAEGYQGTEEETAQGPAVSGEQADLEPPTDGTKDRRMARGVSMKPCATAKMGVSPRRVTQKLCPKEVHELLTAVARSPTGVLLEVGHLVRLSEALVTVALSTSGRIGGSRNRGGRAAVPEASRRVIRAGAPAARRRSSMTAENREEAVAFSSSAKREIKKAMRSDAPSAKGHRGAMKRNGELERAKRTQHLQSWAAKAKRSVSSLVERLESAMTEIGAEDAKLVILHAKGIPEGKAERALRAAASVLRFVTSAANDAIIRGDAVAAEASVAFISQPTERQQKEGEKRRASSSLTQAQEETKKAISIQSWWRMTSVHARARQQKSLTVKVQAAVRGIVARRTIRAIAAAAVVVQAYTRGRRVRGDLSRRRAAAVKVQAAVRAVAAGARVSRTRAEHRRQLAVVVMQKAWRGAVARMMQSRRTIAAITMQRRWRSGVESSAARAAAEAQQVALEQRATVSLQSFFRGHLARVAACRMATAAAAVQARRMSAAAIVVQARRRGILGRAVAAGRKTSAVKIQAFARGRAAAVQYRKVRGATAVLQAWRKMAARAESRRAREASEDGHKTENEKMKEEDKKETKELPVAHHMQVAKNELLQLQESLPAALRSDWWMTDEGKRMKGELDEKYRQLVNAIAERLGHLQNYHPDVVIAPTPPPSSSLAEWAEGDSAAREVLVSEEATDSATSATNITGTVTPSQAAERSTAIGNATTADAGTPVTPRSPIRRRRRSSSTGSRSRSPWSITPALPAVSNRLASPPLPAQAVSVSASLPSSPVRSVTDDGDREELNHAEITSPSAGGLDSTSPREVVSSPADLVAGSIDAPEQRERQEHPPPSAASDTSRTTGSEAVAEDFAVAARRRQRIALHGVQTARVVVELCDFWERPWVPRTTVRRPSPLSQEMHISEAEAASHRSMKDTALAHADRIKEWQKVPPKFAGSVGAGPRMMELRDAIGQSWASHYTLSEHQRRVCHSVPAVLVGRGLGFLLPDSVEEYGRYKAEMEFELNVRRTVYNQRIKDLWETGGLYGCPYFPDPEEGEVYKLGPWAGQPVWKSRRKAFQKSMELLYGMSTEDGSSLARRRPASRSLAVQMDSKGWGGVDAAALAHLSEDQQLEVALWQSFGGGAEYMPRVLWTGKCVEEVDLGNLEEKEGEKDDDYAALQQIESDYDDDDDEHDDDDDDEEEEEKDEDGRDDDGDDDDDDRGGGGSAIGDTGEREHSAANDLANGDATGDAIEPGGDAEDPGACGPPSAGDRVCAGEDSHTYDGGTGDAIEAGGDAKDPGAFDSTSVGHDGEEYVADDEAEEHHDDGCSTTTGSTGEVPGVGPPRLLYSDDQPPNGNDDGESEEDDDDHCNETTEGTGEMPGNGQSPLVYDSDDQSSVSTGGEEDDDDDGCNNAGGSADEVPHDGPPPLVDDSGDEYPGDVIIDDDSSGDETWGVGEMFDNNPPPMSDASTAEVFVSALAATTDDDSSSGGTGSLGEVSDDGSPPVSDASTAIDIFVSAFAAATDSSRDEAGSTGEVSDDGPPPLVDDSGDDQPPNGNDDGESEEDDDDYHSETTEGTSETLDNGPPSLVYVPTAEAPDAIIDDDSNGDDTWVIGEVFDNNPPPMSDASTAEVFVSALAATTDDDDSSSDNTDSLGEVSDDGSPPMSDASTAIDIFVSAFAIATDSSRDEAGSTSDASDDGPPPLMDDSGDEE
eukprot:g5655.t1